MSKVSRNAARLPPFKVSRKRRASESKVVSRHARQLGEVVHAWNSAHGSLYMLFVTLLQSEPMAEGIWHTIQSDKTQREMVEKTALGAIHFSVSIRNAVIWTTKAMHHLASYRNDAAHVQMVVAPDASGHSFDLIPNSLTARSSALKRLSDSPLEKNWHKLRGDLIAIDNYATDLMWAMLTGAARPYSHRPRLQLVPARLGKAPRKTHPRKTAKRKSPPQS